MTRNISIVGAPFNGGQPKTGVETGPSVLREVGLSSTLSKAGWNVIVDKDIDIPTPQEDDVYTGEGKAKRPRYVGKVCENLYNVVEERARAGDFVLTIGGDHSVAAGSIAGIIAVRPETFVVWVDAHADINTPQTSDSGNIHGMPVALLAQVCGKVPGFEYLDKVTPFNLDNIAYIGLRDVDKGEKELIQQRNITAFFMEDVKSMGIEKIVEKVLQKSGSRPIHLSFDVDGIDPKHMPSTGTPVESGLTLEDSVYVCKQLAATRRVTSFDLVEINLALGDDQDQANTRQNSLLLVKSLLSVPPFEPSA
jgi:arginase